MHGWRGKPKRVTGIKIPCPACRKVAERRPYGGSAARFDVRRAFVTGLSCYGCHSSPIQQITFRKSAPRLNLVVANMGDSMRWTIEVLQRASGFGLSYPGWNDYLRLHPTSSRPLPSCFGAALLCSDARGLLGSICSSANLS